MTAARNETVYAAITPILECLLFVSREPVSPRQVAELLDLEETQAEEALEEMRGRAPGFGGLHVVHVAGGYQLRTRPEYAELIGRFLQPEPQKLSRQAVETVAVIAYRQPITQPEIDALRGVSSSGVLKTLLDRGIIREAGRKDSPGRPILYATTDDFLKQFGLADLSDLPDLGEKSVVAVEEAGRRAA